MPTSIEQEIKLVGKAIAKVHRDIEKITEVLQTPNISESDKVFYWQEKSQLRQEESLLRQKEILLIERTPTPSIAQSQLQMFQDIKEIMSLLQQKIHEEDTVAFSKVNSKQYQTILDKLAIEVVAADWKDRPNLNDSFEETFEWGAGKEDSELNRDKCMVYLNKLGFPQSVKLFEGSAAEDLLNTQLSSAGLQVGGNIDVVVLEKKNQDISTARHSILMGIELKKVESTKDGMIERGVVLRHLAASKLNYKTGVLTLMTDLNDSWHFYWFQERTKLIRYKARRAEAVYLIKHFLDDPTNGRSVPESFLSRASWDSIADAVESIQEEGQSDQSGKSREAGSDFASSNLDFMDEEERRDEIFRMMLQNPRNRHLFPEPEVGDTPEDGPPREIFLG
ncbi:MAG: hypothetical protein SGBAC_011673 [Bacillariaceae sp.]